MDPSMDNNFDPDPYHPICQRPCENGGVCDFVEDEGYICICPLAYNGPICEYETKEKTPEGSGLLVPLDVLITILVLAAILLILLLLALFCCLRFRQRKQREKLDSSDAFATKPPVQTTMYPSDSFVQTIPTGDGNTIQIIQPKAPSTEVMIIHTPTPAPPQVRVIKPCPLPINKPAKLTITELDDNGGEIPGTTKAIGQNGFTPGSCSVTVIGPQPGSQPESMIGHNGIRPVDLGNVHLTSPTQPQLIQVTGQNRVMSQPIQFGEVQVIGSNQQGQVRVIPQEVPIYYGHNQRRVCINKEKHMVIAQQPPVMVHGPNTSVISLQ